MSLRFTSQLQVDNLPDEQTNDQFEVIMPSLDLNINKAKGDSGFWGTALSYVTGTKYSPIVEEITFNSKTFKTDTRRVRTGWFNLPSDIQNYKDVSITMFCPNTMHTQYYLEAWRSLVYNSEGEYYNPAKDYKKNIEVYIYGPGGSGVVGSMLPSFHYTLKGCFPYQQGDFKLAYSDNPKRLTITANFKVDAVVLDSSIMGTAILGTIANPTSILDNVTAGFTDSSKYSLNDTYGDVDPNNKSIGKRITQLFG